MTDPMIEAALRAAVKKKPLYYNQEGLDRLTEAVSEVIPKLILDRITSNPTNTGYSFNIHIHYE